MDYLPLHRWKLAVSDWIIDPSEDPRLRAIETIPRIMMGIAGMLWAFVSFLIRLADGTIGLVGRNADRTLGFIYGNLPPIFMVLIVGLAIIAVLWPAKGKFSFWEILKRGTLTVLGFTLSATIVVAASSDANKGDEMGQSVFSPSWTISQIQSAFDFVSEPAWDTVREIDTDDSEPDEPLSCQRYVNELERRYEASVDSNLGKIPVGVSRIWQHTQYAHYARMLAGSEGEYVACRAAEAEARYSAEEQWEITCAAFHGNGFSCAEDGTAEGQPGGSFALPGYNPFTGIDLLGYLSGYLNGRKAERQPAFPVAGKGARVFARPSTSWERARAYVPWMLCGLAVDAAGNTSWVMRPSVQEAGWDGAQNHDQFRYAPYQLAGDGDACDLWWSWDDPVEALPHCAELSATVICNEQDLDGYARSAFQETAYHASKLVNPIGGRLGFLPGWAQSLVGVGLNASGLGRAANIAVAGYDFVQFIQSFIEAVGEFAVAFFKFILGVRDDRPPPSPSDPTQAHPIWAHRPDRTTLEADSMQAISGKPDGIYRHTGLAFINTLMYAPAVAIGVGMSLLGMLMLASMVILSPILLVMAGLRGNTGSIGRKGFEVFRKGLRWFFLGYVMTLALALVLEIISRVELLGDNGSLGIFLTGAIGWTIAWSVWRGNKQQGGQNFDSGMSRSELQRQLRRQKRTVKSLDKQPGGNSRPAAPASGNRISRQQ